MVAYTLPYNTTVIPGISDDAERRRRGEEQGADPVRAPGVREHRETPAGSGDLLRYWAACHTFRSGPAEYNLAAFRVRPSIIGQVNTGSLNPFQFLIKPTI